MDPERVVLFQELRPWQDLWQLLLSRLLLLKPKRLTFHFPDCATLRCTCLHS